MSSVTVTLDHDTEARLRVRAASRGETLDAHLHRVVAREADAPPEPADALARGVAWLTNRTPEEIAAARARVLATASIPRPLPPGKTLIEAVEGTWPGNETDAEIREALERMS